MTAPDPALGPGLADVTLSFHTLGEVDLETRAAAAQAAGWRRIGLSIRRTRAWLADHPLTELTDLLDRHGLVVAELEALRPLLAAPDEHEQFALGLARDLAVPLIQVIGPLEGSPDQGAARLGRLADRAAEQGARLSLEFLPWTNVATIEAAAELVSAAGRPNAGICVDAWHLYRSGGSVASVAALGPLVTSLQLDDGPLVADVPHDLHADCLSHRRLPGDGEFDLVHLLAAAGVGNQGSGCMLSVEVISDQLRQLPADEVARLAAAATIRTLTAFEEARSA